MLQAFRVLPLPLQPILLSFEQVLLPSELSFLTKLFSSELCFLTFPLSLGIGTIIQPVRD
ncbi:hypothetical protein DFO58_1322 [Arthrobacter sp. AG1021]|nr:hypothetical protein DFO58_1322 [Arthrobacter sp. AG1021]